MPHGNSEHNHFCLAGGQVEYFPKGGNEARPWKTQGLDPWGPRHSRCPQNSAQCCSAPRWAHKRHKISYLKSYCVMETGKVLVLEGVQFFLLKCLSSACQVWGALTLSFYCLSIYFGINVTVSCLRPNILRSPVMAIRVHWAGQHGGWKPEAPMPIPDLSR